MKQIAKHHACSKHAIYKGLGMLTDFSLSVIGSCRSRAMPTAHLRQAFVRTRSVASIYKARSFDNTVVARLRSLSPFSNDSISTPLKKLSCDFRRHCGSAYEVVVLEKLIT